MPTFPFDWVDAFADQPFAGNACMVVHDAADIEVEDRMALVRETSLSECAFLVPSETADFGARYYLATREIPLAGHPTIATVTSLLDRGLVSPGASFTLELGAGVIPIRLDGRQVIMTQPAPVYFQEQDPGEIAAIFGLSAGDIVGVPRLVSTGTLFCVAELASKDALRRAVLDPARLAAWQSGIDHPQAGLCEPFLVTLGGETGGDTFARLLLPPPLPAEDPFTGSATGAMAAYLYKEGRIGQRFIAEQGHWMGRPGRASVELLGPRDAIAGVEVGGVGHLLMRGELVI